MKKIALLPVKNEAWILPVYFKHIYDVVDEVIAIDDGSTDNTLEILEQNNAVIYENEIKPSSGWAEFEIRNKLLQIGRERNGTHFVCLDADESFSVDGIENINRLIETLKPGEKIRLPWITLYKDEEHYKKDDEVKDFIFFDDEKSIHDYAFLGVGRTPVHGDIILDNKTKVIHYQNIDWERNQVKQAWYRCSELLKKDRSAKRINTTYRHTLDNEKNKIVKTQIEWVKDLPQVPKSNVKELWQYKKIIEWFNQYGIESFEPLQIWHVKELEEEFVKRLGRKPKSQVYPSWIVALNDLRNKIKNSLR